MSRVRFLVGLALLLCACQRSQTKVSRAPVADLAGQGRSVIFIGLDGADWRILDRFIADGTMPQLGRLIRTADRRVLLTQHPPLSPLLWTTMMTGVSPLEHRILDFTRFHPVTREQEPITSDERAVPAVWNMATAAGKKVGVFGLWATDPPEEVHGVIVSNRPAHDTETVRKTAVDWIAREKPDLAIVYFQETDEIAHRVGGDVDRARALYKSMDAIVEEFRVLAEQQDSDLLIASDHGFDWGGKHEESSTATATAGKWHRDEGIFVHWSRGSSARTSQPARIEQVCATLLALLGLPHDDRLAPPIDGVGARPNQSVDYRRYFRRAKTRAASNPEQDKEAIARLKALGYIGSADFSRAPATSSSTRTPASFNNEGLILGEKGRPEEAERAFLAALAIDPQYPSARTNLAELLIARGRKLGGEAAIVELTRAIALRDGDEPRLLRGRYRLEANDCRGALTDFQAIQRPTALAWASLAAAHGCLGNDERARDALRKSLALDPNQPRLRELLRDGS